MKALTTLVVACVLIGAAPHLFAQDTSVRVLKVPPGLCPATIEKMTSWAARSTSPGVFSMPVDPVPKANPCDAQRTQGWSVNGAATHFGASEAAVSACNAARPANMAPCVITGTLEFR